MSRLSWRPTARPCSSKRSHWSSRVRRAAGMAVAQSYRDSAAGGGRQSILSLPDGRRCRNLTAMSGLAPAPTVVALSGGVDSATAAAMLVESGQRVVGLAMRLYDARGTAASAGGRCCGPRDLEDARAVCAHLDIPFYVVNYAAEFGRAVVDDFVAEYAAGRTPNPCVRCNERVKFGPLI